MSVVILGGNECMVRQYMDICDTFSCKAKVYPKMSACMKKNRQPRFADSFYRNGFTQNDKMRAE